MLFNERLRRVASRSLAGLVAAGALFALASCGGGTYQQKAFVPARILTFGDESSRMEGSQGLKYSVNGISQSTLQIDCTLNPIWVQVIANSYGLVYQHCNVNASFETNAIDLTTVNATVDDVADSVAAFTAGDTFNGNDLVTIWVGMHDILNEYKANATGDETVLLSDMKDQGVKLAGIVNQIENSGAKVILMTVPDMSTSPFAFTESQKGDFDRLQLLQDMSTQFNLGLITNFINDGSRIGLVQVDDYLTNAVRNPSGNGFVQLANEVYGCLDSAPLPTCNDDTLRNDPTTGQAATAHFLWADATHLGATMQNELGNAASSRAHSNPF
jgi:phospholipase/lecithinase/hemolysin